MEGGHRGIGCSHETDDSGEDVSLSPWDAPPSDKNENGGGSPVDTDMMDVDNDAGCKREWARRMLERSGWREGEGLGAERAGMATPLQAKLRLDRTCVGHDEGEALDVCHAGSLLMGRGRGCRTPLSTYHKNGRRREHIEVLGEVKAQEWMMNPLSPQCRWDARHRMPLRKLKDHEERCPSNPKNAHKSPKGGKSPGTHFPSPGETPDAMTYMMDPRHISERILPRGAGKGTLEGFLAAYPNARTSVKDDPRPLPAEQFLEVFETSGRGWGMRCSRALDEGEVVAEYAGEILRKEEAGRRRVEYDIVGLNYMLTVREFFPLVRADGSTVERVISTTVDATRCGGIARFANHSCDPNLYLVPMRIDGAVPVIFLVAKCVIPRGQELCFDYGDGGVESGATTGGTVCLCGKDRCRRFLPGRECDT